MKRKDKTGMANPKIWIGLIIIVALILSVWYFGFRQANIYSPFGCNLGQWTFGSYDSVTKTVIVNANSNNYNSAGGLCYGGSSVSNIDKNSCISFFCPGAWSDEFQSCTPATCDNWFNDKKVISNFGTCTTTCMDTRGIACGINWGYLQTRTSDFSSAAFDGIHVSMPSPFSSWNHITCNGGFVIGYKTQQQPQQQQTQEPTSPSQPQNQQTSSTPSASGNTPEAPSHWYDFIVNFFNSIINWFKT